MRLTTASEVRATIASLVLGDDAAGVALGTIELHPHQRYGVERCRKLLRDHGGALLADEVGLGKTFVALAVARHAVRPVVVAPAQLRDAWASAATQAEVPIRFISTESLGRRAVTDAQPDLVIVDEAHHFRSRGTRRFTAAAALCESAPVLLLSATPIHNRLDDLRSILSLFLGARAGAMTDDQLAVFVVRRVENDVLAASTRLPDVRLHEWVTLADEDCLDGIVALPSGVPPADGDEAGTLLTYTLVRQWASSRAALRSALERRLARARAIEDGLLEGRYPSRAELAAWRFAEGVQQLALPFLMVSRETDHADELLARVRRHAVGVRELLARLECSPDPDVRRADALRAIMRAHPNERVIAFSEFAETVTTLYRALAHRERVAMLTHSGGRVAGGPLSRREVLERFAPGQPRRARPGERLDLLLTTDVLSEGVNLQDASVVVHLDLSWNPARMEQRVGRLRRLGATRDVVNVYALAPPAGAEQLLRLEERLRAKLGIAARAVGVAGTVLPGLTVTTPDAAAAREERIARTLRSWQAMAVPVREPVAAAVRGDREGTIACVRHSGRVTLLAVKGSRVSDERAAVEDLVTRAAGEAVTLDARVALRAQEIVEEWMRDRRVSGVVDLTAIRVAGARRSLLRRIDTIARRVPRHRQSELVPLMRTARTAAAATLSAGAERVLDTLAHAPMSDTAWLHAVREFAAIHAREQEVPPGTLLALLVLRRNA